MTKTWHRPTLWVAAVMAVLAVGTVAGLLVDDRVIQGSNVWLKPLKFTVSLAIYTATLSWLLSLPHKGKRWTSGLGTVIAGIMFVEVGLIVIQGARGMFTHFNTDKTDVLNQVIQGAFALGIPVMFLANVVLALVMAFQRVVDRPTSWSLRTGLGLAVLGMASGYLMVFQGRRKTMATDANGNSVQLSGGHSVGVADGGPGMPGTGWSTTGGDMRVPHFFGMHGLQVMLLLGLVLAAAKLAERTRVRLVLIGAAGYLGLFGLLTWQALRAEPLTRPGTLTLVTLTALVAATAAAVSWTLKSGTAAPTPDRRLVPQR